jgi:hypothetical protein
MASREVTGGEGTAAVTKKLFTRLVICTPAAFAAIADGQAVSINGLTYVVEARVPEQRR